METSLDGLLVTATVPVVGGFGWMRFVALERKQGLQTVDTTTGAVTTVVTVKMFQFHAPQSSGWWEAQVHAKDVLKCIITTAGEPFVVIIDSVTQQQESFATCSDTDTLDRLFVTATVVVVDRFGWRLFDAMEQKRALQIVDTAAGAITAVGTIMMFQFHASR